MQARQKELVDHCKNRVRPALHFARVKKVSTEIFEVQSGVEMG